jgi:predicted RNase H-like HicB family nuclease
MHITVVVEPVAGNGFRAEPVTVRAAGATRQEALENLKEVLRTRIDQGAVIVSLKIPDQKHPLEPYAGMFKNDADFDEVKAIIAENRRQMDADSEIP